MKKVRFDGPGAVLVVEDKRIARGDSEVLSNEAADRLEASDRIDVTVIEEPRGQATATAEKKEED